MTQPTTIPTTDFLLLQLRLKGFWHRKSLGQNFLTNTQVLERIADLTGTDAQTHAIEIGPGPGTLTAQLLRRLGAVTAVEFDQRLAGLHQDVFGTFGQLKFHYADALRTDLAALASQAEQATGLTRHLLTGNLPFQITSPLLFGQCGPGVPWQAMVFMIQKEVADRICARPGGKDYGILTIKLGLWWSVSGRFNVPAADFFPTPKVDASVLRFDPLPAEQTPSAEQWPLLSEYIEAAFAQRRKMLVNTLAARWPRFPGKEKARAILEAQGLDPQIRAEALSIDQHRRLFGELMNG